MPTWLSELLPEWAKALLTPGVMTAIVVCSALCFAASIVLVPWYFCRIPADFYVRRDRQSLPFVPAGSPWRPVVRVLKNALGLLLVIVGFVLLFLPGQGLLTMAAGVMLVDFPGKRRFQHWLVARPSVHRAINALRRRAQKPPLEVEAHGLGE